MFNRDKITEAFQGIVGITSYDENFPLIDADLQSSEYGTYIDALNPLFTHEHFYNCVNEFSHYTEAQANIRAYSSTKIYKIGELVQGVNKIYRSKVSDNVNFPTTDISKWAETNLYSNYFRNRINTAYTQSVQLMIDRKIGSSGGARNILSNIQLYKKKGLPSDAITKTGRFCGFRLSLKSNSINIVLHKLALQLTQSQTDVKIYVYYADKKQPIKIFTLNHAASFDMVEHELTNTVLDWTMGSGDFIIGYYEDELTGSAIRNSVNFEKMSRECCNVESVLDWEQYSKYLSIKPFYVNTGDTNSTTHDLWDADKELYVGENTFGINLWISVSCEISDFIARQKNIFVDVVKQYLTFSLLKDLLFSTRDTGVSRKVLGFAQLEGGIGKMVANEEKKLAEAVARLSFDATGISSPCLPNDNKMKKPRWGSIG